MLSDLRAGPAAFGRRVQAAGGLVAPRELTGLAPSACGPS